jgi:hypothetical protein
MHTHLMTTQGRGHNLSEEEAAEVMSKIIAGLAGNQGPGFLVLALALICCVQKFGLITCLRWSMTSATLLVKDMSIGLLYY